MIDFQMPKAPPKQRNKWPIAVGACCSGCAVLLVALIVLGLLAARQGYSHTGDADRVANQFIEYLAAHKIDQAYSLGSTAFKQQSSLTDFKRFDKIWNDTQGDVTSLTKTGLNWFAG